MCVSECTWPSSDRFAVCSTTTAALHTHTHSVCFVATTGFCSCCWWWCDDRETGCEYVYERCSFVLLSHCYFFPVLLPLSLSLSLWSHKVFVCGSAHRCGSSCMMKVVKERGREKSAGSRLTMCVWMIEPGTAFHSSILCRECNGCWSILRFNR